MKLLQVRDRTVLLPAVGLLNTIPKLPNMVLNEENRKLIIVSMLEERTWINYRTLPSGYSLRQPPYAGQTMYLLTSLYPHVKKDDAQYANSLLSTAVGKLLGASYGRAPEDYPETGADAGFPSGAQIFDHGVSFHWYKGFLHVKWLRPVLNMQEMSVASYFDFVRNAVGDREVAGRTIKQLMETIQVGDFLSDVNQDFLEKCLCSTSK
ncbi:hypothetical protein pEaSNUABM42_00101 [Erwinia phage pEa_SNUABM_42]|nr:hypothetical protein pEaSNUABM43_00101 [Erwinia phage pEa_SNUABM_43]QVW55418.1 hypothetical protein pEaSNUABM42_00101 [Erwinia phage pEa_SNUABM_42]